MKYAITVAGDITSGLSHFALAGLSLIARSLTSSRVVTYWSQESTPRGILEMDDVTPLELAKRIQSLCDQWLNGWAAVRVKYAGGTFSPFSPRFKPIDPKKEPEDWVTHQKSRTAELDKLLENNDSLALQFIQALGEASYWSFDSKQKQPKPDRGASRWEMKTRNAGQEFVSNRFFKFMQEISDWPAEQILSGIEGETVHDPFYNASKGESRTASGFTPPRKTDVALAFVAILGISQFPISYQVRQVSVTPGAFPSNSEEHKLAVLPVTAKPIAPERFESIVISRDWSQIVSSFSTGPETTPLAEQATLALKTEGVIACAAFNIYRTNSKVPETYFEQGKIHLL